MTARPSLERVAALAIRRFLGRDLPHEVLGHSHSLTFRVDAPEGRFLLRVHESVAQPLHPEFHGTAAIESECMWLRALCDETRIGVQEPIASPDGPFVLMVEGADSDASAVREPVPCTLLRWVEGDVVKGGTTEGHGRALGELLAALHVHAAAWTPPPAFERPARGTHEWGCVMSRFDLLMEQGIATPEQGELYGRALELATQRVLAVSNTDGSTGLIHGDLHDENYVHRGRALHPIDFGTCGTGAWLHDIAEAIGCVATAQRRSLLDAYAATRSFDDAHLPQLEAYFIGSMIETLGYHAPNPAQREYLVAAVPAWMSTLDQFLAGQSFLLGADANDAKR